MERSSNDLCTKNYLSLNNDRHVNTSIVGVRVRSITNHTLDMDEWWDFRKINILLRGIHINTEFTHSSVTICSNTENDLMKGKERYQSWFLGFRTELVGCCLQLAQIYIIEVSVKTEFTCKYVLHWSENNYMNMVDAVSTATICTRYIAL